MPNSRFFQCLFRECRRARIIDPTKAAVKRPGSHSWRSHGRIRILAGIAVLATTLLLLNWGLSAMQWTTLTYRNYTDIRYAVMSDTFYEHTLPFSNPLGNETTFTVDLLSLNTQSPTPTDQCYSNVKANIVCPEQMFSSVSSPSTTTEDYVVFYITVNASSAPIVASFTGPQGPLNVTGYIPANSIPLDPGLGSSVSTFQYFPTANPGNYSAHILTVKCHYACSTTNATGLIMTGQSSIAYDRPYYLGGVATVIVGGAGIAVTVAFLAISIFQILRQRKKRFEQGGGS